MDKGTGVVVLVAADHLPATAVDVPEPVQPAADQDRVDRRRGHSEPARDLNWSEPLAPAQVHDLADQRLGRLAGRVGRSARPVLQVSRQDRRCRRLELRAIAVSPALGCRPGHHEQLGGLSDRDVVLDNEPADPQALDRSQGSVSVGHEDLLGVGRFLNSSTPRQEVFAYKINS